MYPFSDFTFTGSDGHSKVSAYILKPGNGEPTGIVQICHGMSEHMGRYVWLAEKLAGAGFIVCGNDHIGHGHTAANADGLGYFERNGHKDIIEDVHKLRTLIQGQYPQLPFFLFGHSMGSFVARLYVTRYGTGLNGCICSGTAGCSPHDFVRLAAARLITVLGMGKRRGRLIHRFTFGGYNKRFETVTGHEWLSRDNDIYKPFYTDPLCNYIFTYSGFYVLFKLLRDSNRKKTFSATPSRLPVLLVSGDMDPVGNYGEGVKKVFRSLKAAGLSDISMTLYPDSRHEMHFELCREEYIRDLVKWMLARTSLF